jgi:hypothetical protein
MLENSSADRSQTVARVPRLRSRVTNGRSAFVEADQRGPWARRWRDLLTEIISDLGGHDGLSEGQRQLARRCATIAIACERMEGEAAKGNDIDLDAYGTLTDRLGRAFGRLGLKRQPRDVTPSLAEYWADIGTETAADAVADEDAANERSQAATPLSGHRSPEAPAHHHRCNR